VTRIFKKNGPLRVIKLGIHEVEDHFPMSNVEIHGFPMPPKSMDWFKGKSTGNKAL
jgi:hypothetical protein